MDQAKWIGSDVSMATTFAGSESRVVSFTHDTWFNIEARRRGGSSQHLRNLTRRSFVTMEFADGTADVPACKCRFAR